MFVGWRINIKVLLFGSKGQLGKEFTRFLSKKKIQLTTYSKRECDITNPGQVKKAIESQKYDFIINTSAYTNVALAEKNYETANNTNNHALKNICSSIKKNTLLIHYSTDYVFDGTLNKAYVEDDVTNPINNYGLSKLNGEELLLKSGVKFMIFRTSWVYDNHSKNFPNTIIQNIKHNKSINVVNDQVGVPNHVEFIVRTTYHCMEKYLKLSALNKDKAHGIYHLSSTGNTTWYDFAKYIIDNFFRKKYPNKYVNLSAVSTKEFEKNIKRPMFSVLSSQKLIRQFDIKLPSWQDGVDQFIKSKL